MEHGCVTGAEVYASVTERQCMLALQLVDDYLKTFPAATASLGEYLGPQCYPHLRQEAPYRANEASRKTIGEESVPELAGLREQMRCWLKCSDCGRHRLVDRHSLPAVDPSGFLSAKPAGATLDK